VNANTSPIDRPYLAPMVVPQRSALASEILSCVAAACGVSVDKLQGRTKPNAIAEARAVAYWMLRRHTKLSNAEIGGELGGRDPSTVLLGVRSCEKRREVEPAFRDFTDRLSVAAKSRMEAM
jgi:chromosomal replication initiation ATPase DnaA